MDLQDWLSKLTAEGLRPATISVYDAVVKAALNQAVRWELIFRNPAQAVVSPRRESRVPPNLTVEQITRLLDEAEASLLGPMITLAVLSRLRWSELAAMRCHDVDHSRGGVQIPAAKTRRGVRAVALGPDALGSLAVQRRPSG